MPHFIPPSNLPLTTLYTLTGSFYKTSSCMLVFIPKLPFSNICIHSQGLVILISSTITHSSTKVFYTTHTFNSHSPLQICSQKVSTIYISLNFSLLFNFPLTDFPPPYSSELFTILHGVLLSVANTVNITYTCLFLLHCLQRGSILHPLWLCGRQPCPR